MLTQLRSSSRLTSGLILLLSLLTLSFPVSVRADRIKDLATAASMRTNQLLGYGLVVGLEGTGDGADVSVTASSMKAILGRLGVNIDGSMGDFDAPSDGKLDIKNVAAVMVTAELPGFAKPGQKIDVKVSALGKAKSLRGGSLILTSLRGVDGQVYALAQGALTATGITQEAAGSRVTVGVPTAARIPSGATVERTVSNPFETAELVVLNVNQPDFTTTNAIVSAINQTFGADTARALDAVSVTLRAPADLSQRVSFMSLVENLTVTPGEPPARVVVNARTGTVVISRNVRVSAAAVSHGTISVTVAATNEVSQPNPLTQGQTTPVQNADVAVTEPNKPMFLFQPGVDLRQIVDAVNQVGASPSALIAILEALKSSGSLRAELLVI